MIYLRLFYEFFLIGTFAVGGGLATLPFLYDLADKTGWYTHAMIVDMIAISESTPGPIGINMATYVGFNVGGVPGAVTATMGLVVPSLIIVTIIARVLTRFRDNTLVKDAFYGLRAVVAGLIAAAGYQIMRISLIDIDLFTATGALADLFVPVAIILFAVMLVICLRFKKLHPVAVIALSAVAGIVLKL